MSMEWFDRVSSELQDHLESICEKYDQEGNMSIDRGAKHPRIEFFIETEDDDREYFCTLFFDPYNEEFYFETFDFEYEQTTRTILADIEEIIEAVHDSFHVYINDVVDDEFDGVIDEEETDIFEEIDVEWETPEVTAFIYEDEVEVTYQFGIVQETGDGVLRRVNRIKTEDDDLIKDETNFIFSKEEASTIIAMIASHMDSLSEFEL
ncbi:hypothetical protein AB3Z07_15635 [Metabacillus halosaccharovorans]|uniref:hypothetical protein n=1 Tax=Metabacillus halosaccharovorans TaxID=930124 RepID=UPI00203DC5FB|nr:hypothetical protein [Metabacillus halosaccharovorans]MCM3440610.1 hypothetical protein [Metabacillus halosaccharovorans]